MHHKERVIGPILAQQLEVEVVVPCDFDTDRFGTFTREIPRAGDQVSAARAKLAAALAATGCDLGIASEGSFAPHPEVPFIPRNVELILFLDLAHNHEVHGWHHTIETNMRDQTITSIEEALSFADLVGFPEHGVVVRRSPQDPESITKDIADTRELKNVVTELLRNSDTAYVETDMRAHRNPTRQASIRMAVTDLLANLNSRCPACQAPGFSITALERGLPCTWCGTPTQLPTAQRWTCRSCSYRHTRPIADDGKRADPKDCPHCNP